MIYQLRITLPGIKGFYRIYKVNSVNSFYTLHKQMQADLSFPADQPILFKAYDASQNVIARYALIDLGYGTVDDITIGKAVKDGALSFDYYYDTIEKKRVIVTVEAEEQGDGIKLPTLMPDAKGPEPAAFDNGYVAYEDLPQEKRKLPDDGLDDEDFDEDDDDDDDEEDEEDIADEDEDK